MGASRPATMLHDLPSILAGERTIFSLRFCEVCTVSGDVAIFAAPFGTIVDVCVARIDAALELSSRVVRRREPPSVGRQMLCTLVKPT